MYGKYSNNSHKSIWRRALSALALILTLAVALGLGLATLDSYASGLEAAKIAPARGSTPDQSNDCSAFTQVNTPASSIRATGLYGVSTDASNDAWAVGFNNAGSDEDALVLHWNGSQWISTTLTIQNQTYLQPLGVYARTPSDVWMAGNYMVQGNTNELNLVMHYDGSAWTLVTLPDYGYDEQLNAITAIAANDVWAVGFYYGTGPEDVHAFALHYDGSVWTKNLDDNTNSPSLDAIDAVSSNDVWAVGGRNTQPYIEHWNGASWTNVFAPASAGPMKGVAAISANDIWAAPFTSEIALHYDGSNWNPVTMTSDTSYVFSAISAASSSEVYAVGTTQGTNVPIAMRYDGAQWEDITSEAPGTFSLFDSVAAAGPGDVWAVGYSSVGSLVEHYSPSACATPSASPTGAATATRTPIRATATSGGTPPTATATPSGTVTCIPEWFETDTANPALFPTALSRFNSLSAIAASSPSDIWAVGSYGHYDGLVGGLHTILLAEHWDGTSWAISNQSNPNGATQSQLKSVAVLSPNDVWAVGYLDTAPGGEHTLTEHWNGVEWSVVSSPSPGTEYIELESVAGTSSNDVWAVGWQDNGTVQRTLIEHWNGTAWSVVANPNPAPLNRLRGVSALTSSDAWAVGYSTSDTGVAQTLTEHWDGTEWSVVASPNSGSDVNHLYSVSALYTNDVWAVGYALSGNTGRDVALHWNGSAWLDESPTDSTADIGINGVDALASDDVWAVANSTAGTDSSILHWDGSSWSSQPSYEPEARGIVSLKAIVATSSSDPWAVGDFAKYNDSDNLVTLAEHPICLSCSVLYTDVPQGSAFYSYIRCLSCQGVFTGYICGGANEPCDSYSDGYFRPNNNVSRGQLSKIIANAAGLNDTPTGQQFQDVPVGSTFYTYIYRLVQHGYVSGYPCGAIDPCVAPGNLPYFRVNNNATRGQISKIVALAAGFNDNIPPTRQTFTDVAPRSTFWVYIEELAARQIISGYSDGTFKPNNNTTRGQLAKIASNAFSPNCNPEAESK